MPRRGRKLGERNTTRYHHQCKWCEAEFVATLPTALYCSRACRDASNRSEKRPVKPRSLLLSDEQRNALLRSWLGSVVFDRVYQDGTDDHGDGADCLRRQPVRFDPELR